MSAADCIFVPAGAAVCLEYRRPCAAITITPAGSAPARDLVRKAGSVVGVFPVYKNRRWPDRISCASASALLADGSPVILDFGRGVDAALAARERLLHEMQQ